MRLTSIIVAFAALASPAIAADMPLKAPLRQLAPIFYGGSGFYWGFGTGGEATKVAAPGAVATYEAGGLLNANAGYTFALTNERWAAIQINYARSNTDASAAAAAVCLPGAVCAIETKQSADIKVMYGAPLSVLSSIFSNAETGFGALPPIPPGAINNTMHPYIAAGVRFTQDHALINGMDQKRIKPRGLLGVGAMYQTNTATTINTFVDWTFGQGRFLLVPGQQIEVGQTFRFGVVANYAVGG